MRWFQDLLQVIGALLFTAAVAVAGAFIVYLKRRIRGETQSDLKYIINGIKFRIVQFVNLIAAAHFTLRRYCAIQLSGNSKNLRVPGIICFLIGLLRMRREKKSA